MTASSLIIVADRGSLRAYRVQETPTRGPHLELMQAFEITDVMNAASTRHERPMTDWPASEAEMDRRICKGLATEIARIAEHNAVEHWSFAAAESIHTKIVEQLPPEIQERIVADLVKLPSAALLSHFRSVQPV